MKLTELLAMAARSERTTSLYAEYNGAKQTVFCIEPGVSIPTEVTHGYQKTLCHQCLIKRN